MENGNNFRENNHTASKNSPEVHSPQSTDTTLSSNDTNQTKPKLFISVLMAVVLLGGLFYNSYRYLRVQKQNTAQQHLSNTLTATTAPSTISPVVRSGNIDWLAKPQKVASVGFFSLIDPHYPYQQSYLKENETVPSGIIKAEYSSRKTKCQIV